MQGEEIAVLDHGYVKFVEDWGRGLVGVPEAGIIEAARQSTQGSFRGWEKDAGLLKFLFNSKPQHAGPFEFAGMVIEVQAPIFVFREWHRHRTQSYNEMSARYSPLPNFKYHPTVDRCIVVPGRNTQANSVKGTGQGEHGEATHEQVLNWMALSLEAEKSAQRAYEFGLDNGIPKEVARKDMPVGQYSRMRAQTNLRNWLAFMTLRADPDAQWEIRQFAETVGVLLFERFPRTWELFERAREAG